MWVLMILYTTTAGQYTCTSLKDCIQKLESAQLDGVQDAYCMSAYGDRVYIVREGHRMLRSEALQ